MIDVTSLIFEPEADLKLSLRVSAFLSSALDAYGFPGVAFTEWPFNDPTGELGDSSLSSELSLPLLTALFTTTLLTLFSLPIVYPNFTKLLIKKMSITKLKY